MSHHLTCVYLCEKQTTRCPLIVVSHQTRISPRAGTVAPARNRDDYADDSAGRVHGLLPHHATLRGFRNDHADNITRAKPARQVEGAHSRRVHRGCHCPTCSAADSWHSTWVGPRELRLPRTDISHGRGVFGIFSRRGHYPRTRGVLYPTA